MSWLRVLAGCTRIHGKEVVNNLRAETFGIQLSKGGSNGTKPLSGFLHCGLFTKHNRTGLGVTLDLAMSSEATESVGLTLSSNSLAIGSGQDALHTLIVEGWSSRLTDLAAAAMRTSQGDTVA